MTNIIGFFFILIIGTLFHFFYEWSNHNKIVGILCAVNESTWEHIKIALGPTFIWMLIEIPIIGSNPNFLLAKFISLVTIIVIIPLFYYLYRFILKKDILFFDIMDFVLAIGTSQLFSFIVLDIEPVSHIISMLCLILIIIIFILYLTLTLNAPKNFLFIDPVNKKTGLDAHMDIEEYKKIQDKQ